MRERDIDFFKPKSSDAVNAIPSAANTNESPNARRYNFELLHKNARALEASVAHSNLWERYASLSELLLKQMNSNQDKFINIASVTAADVGKEIALMENVDDLEASLHFLPVNEGEETDNTAYLIALGEKIARDIDSLIVSSIAVPVSVITATRNFRTKFSHLIPQGS
jgi:hypothetical protein